MTLQLSYAFLPSPNPIRASPDASNPVAVTLQAMVSAPPTTTVSLSKIGIQIPVGQEGAGYLSSVPNLPSPVYDPSCGWTITSSGSWVTVTPSGGGIGQIGGSILFTLESIPICTTPGTVPIAVAEVPGSEVQQYASLDKWPSDFVVVDFYAHPSAVDNLEEPVTLFWKTIPDPSTTYVYSVYSEDWHPKDCLGAGDCYTAQDGIDGVPTPPLDGTTTFALDVVQADSSGHRSIVATIGTTAQVDVPFVSENSYAQPSASGRLAWLYWLASGATSCMLSLDGEPLVEDVPLDTYSDGYLVAVAAPAGLHQLAVTATSQSGAKAPWPFLDFEVRDVTVPIGQPSNLVAVTPDSSTALVITLNSPTVTFVDLPSGDVETLQIPLLFATGLALQPPEGALALVSQGSNVAVVDVPNRQVEANRIMTGSTGGIAITSDGSKAVVTNGQEMGMVRLIDIATRSIVEPPLGLNPRPGPLAITPDGLAFIVDTSAELIELVNVPEWTQTGPTIDLGGTGPSAVAVTPDGTLALVTQGATDTVAVIDVSTLEPEPDPIQVGNGPSGIAVSADSRFALVTNCGDNTVSVIDIPGRRTLPGSLPTGMTPLSVALAPNRTAVLVANAQADYLTMF